MTLNERNQHEILHGVRLAATGNPEAVWNWDSPAGKVRAKRRAQLLSEAAELKPGMHVMEVGCGTGLFTELLASTGATILAVDISSELLALAEKRNLPRDTVEFRTIRFEDVDIDEPFDAIVGSSVLHHLDVYPALQRIYELLKPRGVIAFAEPNMLNPLVWTERYIPAIRVRNGVSPDETAIIRYRLARDLAQIGFTEISVRNVDWLHPATPSPLINVVSNV